MLEAADTVSGLGFAPIDTVALWSAAATSSPRAASRATTPAPANSGAQANTSTAAPLFGSASEELDLDVELTIARMRAAAAQALRNQAAQVAAGGASIRGGASLTYTVGPDGQLYATGVALSYDTTPIVENPQATIAKMQQVRAAALASTSPSAADFAAAATATQVELQARLQLVQQMADQYLDSTALENAGLPGSLLNTFA